MGNAAILWRNLADAAVLTASLEESAMPASRLQGQHVEKRWRAVATSASVLADLGASVSLDTIALLGMTVGFGATVRIRVSTVDATGTAGDALDTGALSAGSAFFDPTYGSAVYALASGVTGRYVRIDIAEAGADYIEAGRLVIGTRSTFGANFAPGSSRGRNDLSGRTRTRGGQMLNEVRRRPRTFDLSFDWITAAEWAAILEPVARDVGLTGDVLILVDAASDNVPRDAVWGFLTDLSPIPFAAIPDIVATKYRVEERL